MTQSGRSRFRDFGAMSEQQSDIFVDGETRLFGAIGDPIAQVKMPALINPIFAELGENILAVPMHVSADGLASAWQGFRHLRNLIGLAVTLPHKGNAARLCDRLEFSARRVGVANCIRREPDGSMTGQLFDGLGFVGGLSAEGHSVKGREIFMVGAGGAASAIAFALADAGAKRLIIANRTRAKAEALAEQLNTAFSRPFATVEEADPAGFSIVINSTSLGLDPSDSLPVDVERLSPGTLVAEVIAKPEISRLLEAAAARGCKIHSGIHMGRHQIRETVRFVIDR
jgi:shikimate dehydrogenase